MKVLFNLLLLFPVLLCAQNKPGSELRIKKAQGTITLDGILDEADWQSADVAKDWYFNYPVDTAEATFKTEARITFDDQFLYVSYIAQDDDTPDLIYSLRRDFDYELNDNIGMVIGPYNDHLNGFFFTLTPKGVQMDGTVVGGGAGGDGFSTFWDNKWYSKVVRYDDKWIAEIAIPFKSIRYKDGLKEWDIVFDRSDKKRNFKTSWIQTPIQFTTGTFAYGGKLIWEDPVPPAHTNISIIPYIAGSTSKDNEVAPSNWQNDFQVGFDAKIGVTPSLNLDLTINPDFSQVEVDQQVINLTRFEYRFPERRNFFLENSDLFSRAGLSEVRPFFSRRVGLVRDSSGLFRKIPIIYGARLSGSITEDWRVSVMNMQTKEELSIGLPAQNYTVATVQRNFWSQSNFAITFVDKESLNVDDADSSKYYQGSIFKEMMRNGNTVLEKNTYNRVLDADLEFLSKDNRFHSSSYIAHSFDAFNTSKKTSAGTYFEYKVRRFYASFRNVYIGENFNAEAGFVPSTGIYPGQIVYRTKFQYTSYPKNSSIVRMGPVAMFDHIYIPGGTLADKNYSVGYTMDFTNTMKLELTYNYIFQRMTNAFNPIDSEKYPSFLPGEVYDWNTVTATFQSNTRQILNFNLQSTYGGFYNGTNFNVNGQINARYQPYGNISLRFDYNDINLADGYGAEKLFLIGPRLDLTLTDKIFITTYVQYNNVLDNMNLNARFQWRYKPASDFFIVYTENYLPQNLTSKNKALVFKLTYWFNL